MTGVVGIDEVGRGSWAGPLVAAAVCLLRPIDGLTDSKLLTAAQRQKFSERIYQRGIVNIGWVTASELDSMGLSVAVATAMQRAIKPLLGGGHKIIIDGNINYLRHIEGTSALIKADKSIPSVSAASIVAKVARDAHMRDQDQVYPEYGFSKNVGYGTALHRQQLLRYGPCEIHRSSFRPIKELISS